ncbi:MAG: putative rRNA maturation factor [Patescibacteria group bacterium]|jgi:probable rRNA maturation factor|nr:putative rRNA maturation factor [Patescibacteria group bacterium]
MNNLVYINKRGYRVDFSWLDDFTKVVSKKFKIKKEISIAILSPLEIKKLNKIYRQKNKVTDVLSFNLDDEKILGEIVICLEQAKKQAKEKKISLQAELKLLVVHGTLHLLGYDHEVSEVEAERQEKEEKLLLNKF